MKITTLLLVTSILFFSGCDNTKPIKIEVPQATTTVSTATSGEPTYVQQSLPKLSDDVKEGKVENYNAKDPLNRRVLAVINYVRGLDIKCNDSQGKEGPVESLEWSDALEGAALEHSIDMLTYNNFSHYGSGRSTDITGLELKPQRSSYYTERIAYNGFNGENLLEVIGKVSTTNFTVPDDYWIDMIDLWIHSKKGHCSILLNDKVNQVGMGQAFDSGHTKAFYTVDLGKGESTDTY